MQKAHLTNLVAFIFLCIGLLIDNTLVLMIGLFALSGALTNWLAIHMLFEKVPGLYGSGVIQNQFEAFKDSLHRLMMSQFFSAEQVDAFINSQTPVALELSPVIEKVDLSPTYDKLVDTIMNSSFGSMLSMFGGAEALKPLKEPFVENLKQGLIEIADSQQFHALLQQQLDQPDRMQEIQSSIDQIIRARLNELTPKMVKEMIQTLIHQHLGWLVVWGGVFGGLIGFVSAFLVTVI